MMNKIKKERKKIMKFNCIKKITQIANYIATTPFAAYCLGTILGGTYVAVSVSVCKGIYNKGLRQGVKYTSDIFEAYTEGATAAVDTMDEPSEDIEDKPLKKKNKVTK